MEYRHVPVMLEETLKLLDCRAGGVYLDCTVGGGGHALGILERITPGGRLIGIDRDEEALAEAWRNLEVYRENLVLVKDNFARLKLVLGGLGVSVVDGVLFDLGVSSLQLDEPERGFSYNVDAPLDMRMDVNSPVTAADLVNELPEEELARIIKEYGEERWAGRIAQFIVQHRRRGRIETTLQLVEVIKRAIPAAARRKGPHPARRTFQALRIAVNDELRVLRGALMDAVDVLAPGGRICVISFHSLEDRQVKQIFRKLAGECDCPPGFPGCTCKQRKELEILTSKPVVPSEQEIKRNPRARSARLRAAMKVLMGKERE